MSLHFELIEPTHIKRIIPLLQMLNTTLTTDIIDDRLTEMLGRGYQCLGVYDGQQLIGICGLWLLTKVYSGRHLELDNVFILPQYRSQGTGALLSAWVDDYALSQGCIANELNAFVANKSGQKFWMNQGYQILGFHFQKHLI